MDLLSSAWNMALFKFIANNEEIWGFNQNNKNFVKEHYRNGYKSIMAWK